MYFMESHSLITSHTCQFQNGYIIIFHRYIHRKLKLKLAKEKNLPFFSSYLHILKSWMFLSNQRWSGSFHWLFWWLSTGMQNEFLHFSCLETRWWMWATTISLTQSPSLIISLMVSISICGLLEDFLMEKPLLTLSVFSYSF